MKRRAFLETTVVGAAAALWAGRSTHAAPEAGETALVPLGKHLKVCRIGAGTGMKGWMRQTNQTRLGQEAFEALLRYEYDQGVRLFDCADLYGTHPYVGRALKGKPRESFQIVTKLWYRKGGVPDEDKLAAETCVQRFLKELGLEYLDLVQLHCLTEAKWPEQMRQHMDALATLKTRGLIRAHGVSCHSLEALKAAAAETWVDVIHARINPFNAKMDGPPEQVLPVLKQARAAGKGVIGIKINGEGTLTPEQLAESIRFALSCGGVDAMLAGFETNEQVDKFKALVKEHLAVK